MPELSFIHTVPFYEITALLVLAALTGFLSLLLRQPMIVSFIAAGILAGPSVLDIVQSHEYIELMAELGIALLLFLVGLKLDVSLVRSLGMVSLATGLGQVLFTAVIGFFIGQLIGLDMVTSLYVAVALTFSSTIIIVKLLSDKKEVDSLHGRIALGFLIVQDIVVVVAMMVLSAFGIKSGDAGQGSVLLQIGSIVLYGMLMVLFVTVFIRYLATPLVDRFARSPELLVTFALGWAAFLASMGDALGFSMELGGLLAGVSLASTPIRESIVSRMASLRDFLLLFFFISLGMNLDLSLLGAQMVPALLFSLFVLVGNPLIVMIIMGLLGYRKRTGFLAGLTVAQISEFSLIFIAMGRDLGHLQPEAIGLVTLVGMITIALSVYMITYSHSLYRLLEPVLGVFEQNMPAREEAEGTGKIEHKRYDIVLFGIGRYGTAVARELEKSGYAILMVDFNPDEVRKWKKRGYDAIYGDASDQEFLAGLPLDGVKWVISAVSQHELGLTHEDPRLVLIDALKTLRFPGRIAVSTQRLKEKEMLKERGADVVFLPFDDAAGEAARRINRDLS
ncbi:cation:proton antiporter [Prosthecochloris sp. N3]|uniref:Cation:proton antiporter n=1 Tax=Prosthecochloris ethylica TaxID=2743976 RepID=A0ABR9XPJ3_9CHLB|nr:MULTISPECIES: cation:proton antiporter family protein [Prosthecochloris]MBF0586249.1 cation:proton antiporter [Prosthecochloris ethylica]MBF0635955.1 cation:proton antiporter [Prosthecochloris ethylica]NUK47370.1 cation:proton antiporter [Prosthecochloris ethylica]RNA64925.1 sodium:proton exchanger [Prosthecochloris sp. ZM_2]